MQKQVPDQAALLDQEAALLDRRRRSASELMLSPTRSLNPLLSGRGEAS